MSVSNMAKWVAANVKEYGTYLFVHLSSKGVEVRNLKNDMKDGSANLV